MMSKRKAHFFMILFDLLALSIFWLGYDEINHVVIDIAHSADSVEFNNRVGFFFIGVLMPMAHLFAIYEYFWPKSVKKRMALFNWSAVILLIVLFASAFFISARLGTYVEQAGYLYCHPADKSMTFCTYLVYTKNEATCRRLVEEKRKPRR
jgi:hypothetical protein